MSRNIHFVDSVRLDDTATVLTTLGNQVGTRAARYPDGETGVRENWVRWQSQTFADHANFVPGSDDQTSGYTLRDGADQAALSFDELGYAAEALASYATFESLRREGVVPEGVRFQVSLPTPLAVISVYVAPEHAAAVEPAYDLAMQRELASTTHLRQDERSESGLPPFTASPANSAASVTSSY